MKKTAYGVDFVIWGIENQQRIHYAMPLRHMIEDALSYLKEYNEIAKKNAHVGTVRVSGLKPFPKYQLEINITFEVGSSQEVKVNIQEELSGINKTEILKLI